MTKDEMTLSDMLKALWPKLSPEDRESAVLAEEKLKRVDTFSDSPAGHSETNFHGEAYAELSRIAHKLRAQEPGDPVVQAFSERYAR